jgi:hypothetical protein
MSQKAPKKKRDLSSGPARRKERRFATSSTFIPLWVALIGMAGSVVLGAGVFGLWVIDPPYVYGAYLVAAGGLGLGVALWFGQPAESAVAVGDAGIAVEDGRDVKRMHWYEVKSARILGGQFVLESRDDKLKFSIGANPRAAAWALKQLAERTPNVIDIDKSFAEKLPAPDAAGGSETVVDNDQVAGRNCASSGRPLQLEEEARVCDGCGQIFHRDTVPTICTSCEKHLEGHLLRA